MNAISKILLVLSTLFCSVTIYSQKKIFTGYYIGNTNDTIRGTFPHYTQWANSPAKVQFLPTSATIETVLTPDNCRQFYIDNYDTYLSYTGERLVNPIDLNPAIDLKDSIGFNDKVAPVTAFIRLIAKTGNCEIYELNDNIRRNFFYRLSGGPMQELKFKAYYDQGRLNEVYEYRQQLNALFASEIAQRNIDAQLDKLEYTEDDLYELLQKLTPVQRQHKKSKRPEEGLIISAGVSINQFNVSGDRSASEVNTRYNSSISPILSIGYLSAISRNFGRTFVFPHVSIYSYKNSGKVPDAYSRTTTFKASLAVAPVITLGYNIINRDKLRAFASAGGGVLFLVNNKQVDERTMGQSTQTATSDLLGLSYNVNASAGAALNNKWIITATYNVPAPVASYIFFTPRHSSIQLTLGYKL